MVSKLKWSNRAHTELSVKDGSFKDGNAQWLGYVDLARHIAGNPSAFHTEDLLKARAILVAHLAEILVKKINEVLNVKELD